MTDFKNKRVTVLGLGHFGGGVAVSRWLVEQGARVLVYDQSPADKLAESIAQLEDLPIVYRLGPDQKSDDILDVDLIVASPAIAPSHFLLQAARRANVPVTTEICLFVQRCAAPVIGVTGTKGKSTTSTLLHRMLITRRTAWLGGNIGKSLLADLPLIKSGHLVVLELSSFMLEHLAAIQWSPHVAVVTMITSDHLDWHGSQANYIAAKSNIVRFQKPGDSVLLNSENPATEILKQQVRQGVTIPLFATPVERDRWQLQLAGEHNQLNAQAAYAAAALFGISRGDAQAAIADFTGLVHRLQLVLDRDGVKYINDSISTLPDAAIAALRSFPDKKVIHIIGGSGKKKQPLDALCTALGDRAKAVLCIGETGPAINSLLPPSLTQMCGTLQSAVDRAMQIAEPGDIVLLSPGHPSYDQFTNFETRGAEFVRMLTFKSR